MISRLTNVMVGFMVKTLRITNLRWTSEVWYRSQKWILHRPKFNLSTVWSC